MIENEEQAREYVAGLADEVAIARLECFAGLLIAENKRQNLISKASEPQIWRRHIADSAQLLEHVPRETLDHTRGEPWLDLGTGAGLPGLVIAALLPDFPVRLVESRARRVEFLRDCISQLDLPFCEVLHDRLERIEPFSASVISARAFAPLEKLLRLSAPFSTKRTRYLLPKGRSAAHELEHQKPSIRKLFHVEQSLTDRDAGIIVSA
ncbi:16S rRNA (guanine(527)-N(7))-methyltransferase RsmG [Erythrobacter sp. THAF29]|uniref:16S rRNA (guanine(527)-N(7))-methyltransferase RsmG n=1 Tax=Erythrobacter sp. THAF29 TaxID=2587851 RepID=UPI0012692D4A|nr:16S rRNA (guanine(527)-N(7))-methyltransferase RsmG [Erythrobacter sp. THAF29]QFT76364.1 Ribosomal RNA small subunit methyltransferase G [Erythrobacter sp. THAF29]